MTEQTQKTAYTKNSRKILVVSDTHGDYRRLDYVIEQEKPFDMLIHCGDIQGDIGALLEGADYPYYAVKGNCDTFSSLPELLTLKVGYYQLMITHGHKLDVKYSKKLLLYEARKNHADVVLFGHTHIPEVYRVKDQGTLVVNPGSLAYPGQFPRVPTYAVLTISEDDLPSAVIRKLKV